MRSSAFRRMLFAAALFAAGCDKDATRANGAPVAAPSSSPSNPSTMRSIHTLTMKRLDGTSESLSTYTGKVLLVVNTASECGYTPQYEGLEKLYERDASKGLVVLGFPSNDFGGQEPGSPQEIAAFCKNTYGVTFPMFEKVSTKGPNRAELYAIVSELGEPKWNFHKYLVDKKGVPVKAFPSSVKPDAPELLSAIDAELAK